MLTRERVARGLLHMKGRWMDTDTEGVGGVEQGQDTAVDVITSSRATRCKGVLISC
jgi:hypothetical protein